MLAWIGALSVFGSLACTLMFLFRHPAHGFVAFRLGIGLTILVAAAGILVFLFERRYVLIGILALLGWIVGVMGGDLLISRMVGYEQESEGDKELAKERAGYLSDLLLQVFLAALAAVVVLVALVK